MSLLPAVNNGSSSQSYFITREDVINPLPIPGPPGAQGAIGPAGPQGLAGINSFGSWYYAAGLLPPNPQTVQWNATDIYFSLTQIPPGSSEWLYSLKTQFQSTGAVTLYINSTDVGGADIGFTASVTAVNFVENLGYAQFTYVLVGAMPLGFVIGNVVNFFDGGGSVGPAGPPGPQGPQGIPGPVGPAGTVTVGATNTLPPGSAATVVNVGTPTAAILNFGIPEGDPADASTWSTYPATQAVNINNQNITNVNTINSGTLGATHIDCYQNFVTGFGSLQVGSPNPLSANPGTVNVNGTLAVQRGFSNFAVNALGIEYDGTATVPANNSIKFGCLPVSGVNTCRLEMNTITSPAAISMFSPAYITIDAAGAADLAAGGAVGIAAGGVVTIESAAKDITLQGSGGTYSDVHMLGGTLDGMGNITGQVGSGVAIDNLTSLRGLTQLSTIQVLNDVDLSNNDIRPGAIVDSTGSTGTANQILTAGTAGNTLRWTSPFRDTTEFFVSNNGSDATGDGSQQNPFATIQNAITQAELISSAANICVINVASGHYTENLTFAKGYVMLNGVLSTQTANEVTEITGSITISCAGAADLFNRQVVFQGFNITCGVGQTITDNSTTSHSVAFQDCKIFTNGRTFNGISTGADARTYFTNVEISQTNAAITDSTIFVNRGVVEIERVDVTTDGNAPCLEIAGNATLQRCSLTTFENTNVSATVAPICLISTTNTAVMAIGQTTFTYTSTVSKAASPTSSGIRLASPSATLTLILLNNYFTMSGLTGSGNNVITYNGIGPPTLLMNENRSLFIPVAAPNTTTIQAGITKINYTNINGPAAGSYSNNANQTIGTAPVALQLNTTEKQFNTTLIGTRVYTTATGTFRFDYSVQLENTSGGDQTVKIWIAKNGTNVPRSASQVVVGNNGQTFPFCSYTLDMNAGDYLEVYANSTSATNVRALAVAAVVGPPAIPAVPSVIVNLTQIGS